MSSESRCALVTGASRGIGRSVALRLARDGYDVAGCFRAASEMSAKTEEDVRALGVRCLFAECDVGDGDAVQEFVQAAEREVGPITALVCSAGIVRDNPLVLMPPDDWRAVVDTNLTGAWNVCRTVVFQLL